MDGCIVEGEKHTCARKRVWSLTFLTLERFAYKVRSIFKFEWESYEIEIYIEELHQIQKKNEIELWNVAQWLSILNIAEELNEVLLSPEPPYFSASICTASLQLITVKGLLVAVPKWHTCSWEPLCRLSEMCQKVSIGFKYCTCLWKMCWSESQSTLNCITLQGFARSVLVTT